MPDGDFKIAGAYIEVHLQDDTDAEAVKIRTKVEGDKPISLKTWLEDPENLALIREKLKAEPPVKLPVEADTAQAQKALKELSSTVDSTTKDNGSKFQSMLSSTAAAWTGLGALVAGPAVAGGLAVVAGGFAAIAIAAEHSTPQVQQAFATMKTEGVDLLKNGFSSLTPVIVSSMGTMTDGIRRMGPEIQTISGELSPFLTTLSGSLVTAAQTLLPAFASALGNASPLAKALGTGIDDIATGIAQFLTHLDFNTASTGLQLLLTDVGRLLPVVGGLVNAVMPFANALLSSVIPAATNLANVFIGDLSPAVHLFGAAISALGPVLNFMSGPTATVLVGVLAFKALSSATTGLLSGFNVVSSGASALANKVLDLTGNTDKSVGSFSLMTDAMKKAAVQQAVSTLGAAKETAAQAQANLVKVEAAAVDGKLAATETELTAARAAATAATEAEAEATTAMAAASEASSFAFGPVGIGLGVLAGVMTLFTGTTKSDAVPAVENFTQKLNDLASAAPGATRGILGADPALSKLVNQAAEAGVSVNDLNNAMQQGGQAQQAVTDKISNATAAVGAQAFSFTQTNVSARGAAASTSTYSLSVKALADQIGNHTRKMEDLTPAQQAAVKQYQDLQALLTSLGPTFAQNADAQKAAGSVAAQSVQLTGEQQAAAAGIAKQFGLSVDDVAAALSRLPGAGSTAADGVSQITSAFTDGEVKSLNAQQSVTDYFTNLQKSAAQANESLLSAQHSYAQSVTSVSDAEHSAAQSAQAVTTARQGVATATRSVTDAEHSYADAQHSTAQAQQAVMDAELGVTTAEQNLTKSQQAETQAQLALTQAREQAAEQLKSLHLQLNDQAAAEQQAQLKLFQQIQSSANAGVTQDNAASILATPITASNTALKQSALDLVNAQNSLADTLNTGANLREQVTAADKAGVAGSQQVVSAQQQVKSAQEQVKSSELALVKSHQAVTDAVYALSQANYNLGKAQQAIVDAQANVVKAQQGVTDAIYNESKARQAVKDAIFNEQQSLYQLRQAQDAARQANDLNTSSLDLNTQAGRNNFAQLQTMFTAIPTWIAGTDRYNTMVQETADKFNISRQAAFDFLKQQGQIPANFKFTTTGVAQLDTSQLDPFVGGYFSGGFRSKGGQIGYADGGPIAGPGGPKADVIPIMASDGEFMQPADVVAHYGVGYMEALRQKKLPKFANGGQIVASNIGGLDIGSSYVTTVAMATELGLPHPPQLSQWVPPPPGSGIGGGSGPIPSGQHLALIDAALAADGVPHADWARWEAGMNTLIQRESNWNAGAVNRWDSNAAAGHPSGGLTQTIGPTFESNRNRGLPDNMFDPVANIAASINYIMRRYGDISAVQQANPHLPPKGYALGDIVGTDGASLLGTMARTASIIPANSPRLLGDNPKVPESYIPNDPHDPQAQQILSETNRRMGRMSGSVTNNINIQTVETDPAMLAAKVSSRLGWAMRGAS
ncbi:hypothetical protein [Amycolatopsis sp. NBC_01480]|uniref:hypothetical protein n=1 Tax=Amycolatopsis sp. NBC_01480 TaxID=2903562 RepID=UPI002E298A79|nr:hypothetical protein [Amycolatopsis sp. NBC_01480]